MGPLPAADGAAPRPPAEDSKEALSPSGEAPSAGTVVAAKYRLERPLAEGGMGVVWLGQHIELEQPVAIKLLRPNVAHNETVAARFLNEARAAAAMRSEHVVRVMDVGQLQSGEAYIVMEHLEGTDLQTLLRREGPLSVDRALDYVLQACSALQEAHDRGIIHRDIKPENLFVTRVRDRELIKVVDFGLAKRFDVEQERKLTGPQDCIGSPGYMSPEQMTTPHEVDARTDLWALGVVLYQLLSGRLPFDGRTVAQTCAQVLHAMPPPLRDLRPDIDAELEAVVRRCLEKLPDARYPSVADFVADVERYRSAALADTQLVKRPSTALRAPRELHDPELKIPMKRTSSVVAVALGALVCGAGGAYAADRMGWIQLRALAADLMAPTPAEEEAPVEGESTRLKGSSSDDAAPTVAEPLNESEDGDESADGDDGDDARDDSTTGDTQPALAADETPSEEQTPSIPKTGTEPAQAPSHDASDNLTPAQKERRYRAYLQRQGLRPLRDVLAETEGEGAPNTETRSPDSHGKAE